MSWHQLTLEDVHRPLVEALQTVDLAAAPVNLIVRCGRGRCQKPLGQVVRIAALGLAWIPQTPPPPDADPATAAPGTLPLLLPTTSADQRQFFCEVIYAVCSKHGSWALGASELTERAWRSGAAPWYVDRGTPTEFGPLVNNVDNWSETERDATTAALAQLAQGTWPPAGVSRHERAVTEARMAAAMRRIRNT